MFDESAVSIDSVLNLDAIGAIQELQQIANTNLQTNFKLNLGSLKAEIKDVFSSQPVITARLNAGPLKAQIRKASNETSVSLRTNVLGFKTDLTSVFKDSAKELGDNISKAVKPSKQGFLGSLFSAIISPFKLLAVGAIEGIGFQVTKKLGKGLEDGLTNVFAPIIGSAELVGEKAGEFFASEALNAINKGLKRLEKIEGIKNIFDQIKKELEKEIKEFQRDVSIQNRSRQYRQRKEKTKKVSEAKQVVAENLQREITARPKREAQRANLQQQLQSLNSDEAKAKSAEAIKKAQATVKRLQPLINNLEISLNVWSLGGQVYLEQLENEIKDYTSAKTELEKQIQESFQQNDTQTAKALQQQLAEINGLIQGISNTKLTAEDFAKKRTRTPEQYSKIYTRLKKREDLIAKELEIAINVKDSELIAKLSGRLSEIQLLTSQYETSITTQEKQKPIIQDLNKKLKKAQILLSQALEKNDNNQAEKVQSTITDLESEIKELTQLETFTGFARPQKTKNTSQQLSRLRILYQKQLRTINQVSQAPAILSQQLAVLDRQLQSSPAIEELELLGVNTSRLKLLNEKKPLAEKTSRKINSDLAKLKEFVSKIDAKIVQTQSEIESSKSNLGDNLAGVESLIGLIEQRSQVKLQLENSLKESGAFDVFTGAEILEREAIELEQLEKTLLNLSKIQSSQLANPQFTGDKKTLETELADVVSQLEEAKQKKSDVLTKLRKGYTSDNYKTLFQEFGGVWQQFKSETEFIQEAQQKLESKGNEETVNLIKQSSQLKTRLESQLKKAGVLDIFTDLSNSISQATRLQSVEKKLSQSGLVLSSQLSDSTSTEDKNALEAQLFDIVSQIEEAKTEKNKLLENIRLVTGASEYQSLVQEFGGIFQQLEQTNTFLAKAQQKLKDESYQSIIESIKKRSQIKSQLEQTLQEAGVLTYFQSIKSAKDEIIELQEAETQIKAAIDVKKEELTKATTDEDKTSLQSSLSTLLSSLDETAEAKRLLMDELGQVINSDEYNELTKEFGDTWKQLQNETAFIESARQQLNNNQNYLTTMFVKQRALLASQQGKKAEAEQIIKNLVDSKDYQLSTQFLESFPQNNITEQLRILVTQLNLDGEQIEQLILLIQNSQVKFYSDLAKRVETVIKAREKTSTMTLYNAIKSEYYQLLESYNLSKNNTSKSGKFLTLQLQSELIQYRKYLSELKNAIVTLPDFKKDGEAKIQRIFNTAQKAREQNLQAIKDLTQQSKSIEANIDQPSASIDTNQSNTESTTLLNKAIDKYLESVADIPESLQVAIQNIIKQVADITNVQPLKNLQVIVGKTKPNISMSGIAIGTEGIILNQDIVSDIQSLQDNLFVVLHEIYYTFQNQFHDSTKTYQQNLEILKQSLLSVDPTDNELNTYLKDTGKTVRETSAVSAEKSVQLLKERLQSEGFSEEIITEKLKELYNLKILKEQDANVFALRYLELIKSSLTNQNEKPILPNNILSGAEIQNDIQSNNIPSATEIQDAIQSGVSKTKETVQSSIDDSSSAIVPSVPETQNAIQKGVQKVGEVVKRKTTNLVEKTLENVESAIIAQFNQALSISRKGDMTTLDLKARQIESLSDIDADIISTLALKGTQKTASTAIEGIYGVFKVLQAVETVVLGLDPSGAAKMMKNILKPLVLFAAASQVPGVNMLTGEMANLVTGALTPYSASMGADVVASLSSAITQLFSNIPFGGDAIASNLIQGVNYLIDAAVDGGTVAIGEAVSAIATGTFAEKIAGVAVKASVSSNRKSEIDNASKQLTGKFSELTRSLSTTQLPASVSVFKGLLPKIKDINQLKAFLEENLTAKGLESVYQQLTGSSPNKLNRPQLMASIETEFTQKPDQVLQALASVDKQGIKSKSSYLPAIQQSELDEKALIKENQELSRKANDALTIYSKLTHEQQLETISDFQYLQTILQKQLETIEIAIKNFRISGKAKQSINKFSGQIRNAIVYMQRKIESVNQSQSEIDRFTRESKPIDVDVTDKKVVGIDALPEPKKASNLANIPDFLPEVPDINPEQMRRVQDVVNRIVKIVAQLSQISVPDNSLLPKVNVADRGDAFYKAKDNTINLSRMLIDALASDINYEELIFAIKHDSPLSNKANLQGMGLSTLVHESRHAVQRDFGVNPNESYNYYNKNLDFLQIPDEDWIGNASEGSIEDLRKAIQEYINKAITELDEEIRQGTKTVQEKEAILNSIFKDTQKDIDTKLLLEKDAYYFENVALLSVLDTLKKLNTFNLDNPMFDMFSKMYSEQAIQTEPRLQSTFKPSDISTIPDFLPEVPDINPEQVNKAQEVITKIVKLVAQLSNFDLPTNLVPQMDLDSVLGRNVGGGYDVLNNKMQLPLDNFEVLSKGFVSDELIGFFNGYNDLTDSVFERLQILETIVHESRHAVQGKYGLSTDIVTNANNPNFSFQQLPDNLPSDSFEKMGVLQSSENYKNNYILPDYEPLLGLYQERYNSGLISAEDFQGLSQAVKSAINDQVYAITKLEEDAYAFTELLYLRIGRLLTQLDTFEANTPHFDYYSKIETDKVKSDFPSLTQPSFDTIPDFLPFLGKNQGENNPQFQSIQQQITALIKAIEQFKSQYPTTEEQYFATDDIKKLTQEQDSLSALIESAKLPNRSQKELSSQLQNTGLGAIRESLQSLTKKVNIDSLDSLDSYYTVEDKILKLRSILNKQTPEQRLADIDRILESMVREMSSPSEYSLFDARRSKYQTEKSELSTEYERSTDHFVSDSKFTDFRDKLLKLQSVVNQQTPEQRLSDIDSILANIAIEMSQMTNKSQNDQLAQRRFEYQQEKTKLNPSYNYREDPYNSDQLFSATEDKALKLQSVFNNQSTEDRLLDIDRILKQIINSAGDPSITPENYSLLSTRRYDYIKEKSALTNSSQLDIFSQYPLPSLNLSSINSDTQSLVSNTQKIVDAVETNIDSINQELVETSQRVNNTFDVQVNPTQLVSNTQKIVDAVETNIDSINQELVETIQRVNNTFDVQVDPTQLVSNTQKIVDAVETNIDSINQELVETIQRVNDTSDVQVNPTQLVSNTQKIVDAVETNIDSINQELVETIQRVNDTSDVQVNPTQLVSNAERIVGTTKNSEPIALLPKSNIPSEQILSTDISETNYPVKKLNQLLQALLQEKEELNADLIKMNEEVQRFNRQKSSIVETIASFDKLISSSNAQKENVQLRQEQETNPVWQQAFAEIIKALDRKITIDSNQKTVAEGRLSNILSRIAEIKIETQQKQSQFQSMLKKRQLIGEKINSLSQQDNRSDSLTTNPQRVNDTSDLQVNPTELVSNTQKIVDAVETNIDSINRELVETSQRVNDTSDVQINPAELVSNTQKIVDAVETNIDSINQELVETSQRVNNTSNVQVNPTKLVSNTQKIVDTVETNIDSINQELVETSQRVNNTFDVQVNPTQLVSNTQKIVDAVEANIDSINQELVETSQRVNDTSNVQVNPTQLVSRIEQLNTQIIQSLNNTQSNAIDVIEKTVESVKIAGLLPSSQITDLSRLLPSASHSRKDLVSDKLNKAKSLPSSKQVIIPAFNNTIVPNIELIQGIEETNNNLGRKPRKILDKLSYQEFPKAEFLPRPIINNSEYVQFPEAPSSPKANISTEKLEQMASQVFSQINEIPEDLEQGIRLIIKQVESLLGTSLDFDPKVMIGELRQELASNQRFSGLTIGNEGILLNNNVIKDVKSLQDNLFVIIHEIFHLFQNQLINGTDDVRDQITKLSASALNIKGSSQELQTKIPALNNTNIEQLITSSVLLKEKYLQAQGVKYDDIQAQTKLSRIKEEGANVFAVRNQDQINELLNNQQIERELQTLIGGGSDKPPKPPISTSFPDFNDFDNENKYIKALKQFLNSALEQKNTTEERIAKIINIVKNSKEKISNLLKRYERDLSSLTKAKSTYEVIIQTSSDQQVKASAQNGLKEVQSEIDRLTRLAGIATQTLNKLPETLNSFKQDLKTKVALKEQLNSDIQLAQSRLNNAINSIKDKLFNQVAQTEDILTRLGQASQYTAKTPNIPNIDISAFLNKNTLFKTIQLEINSNQPSDISAIEARITTIIDNLRKDQTQKSVILKQQFEKYSLYSQVVSNALQAFEEIKRQQQLLTSRLYNTTDVAKRNVLTSQLNKLSNQKEELTKLTGGIEALKKREIAVNSRLNNLIKQIEFESKKEQKQSILLTAYEEELEALRLKEVQINTKLTSINTSTNTATTSNLAQPVFSLEQLRNTLTKLKDQRFTLLNRLKKLKQTSPNSQLLPQEVQQQIDTIDAQIKQTLVALNEENRLEILKQSVDTGFIVAQYRKASNKREKTINTGITAIDEGIRLGNQMFVNRVSNRLASQTGQAFPEVRNIETSILELGVAHSSNIIKSFSRIFKSAKGAFKQIQQSLTSSIPEKLILESEQITRPQIELTRSELTQRINRGAFATSDISDIDYQEIVVLEKINKLLQESKKATKERRLEIAGEITQLETTLSQNQAIKQSLQEQVRIGKQAENSLSKLSTLEINLDSAIATNNLGRFKQATKEINKLQSSINNLQTSVGWNTGIKQFIIDLSQKMPPAIKALYPLLNQLKWGIGSFVAYQLLDPINWWFNLRFGIERLITTVEKLEASKVKIESFAGSFQTAIDTANKYKISIDTIVDAYGQLVATTKDTSLEGDKTTKLLTDMAQASRVFGLSAEDTSGVLLAMRQILSGSTLQLQELNQISERLPGAMTLSAKAMRLTTSELRDLTGAASISSEEFATKFTEQLRLASVSGLSASLDTIQAERTNLLNAVKEFQLFLGSQFGGALKNSLKILSGLLKGAKVAIAVLIPILGLLIKKMIIVAALNLPLLINNLQRAFSKTSALPFTTQLVQGLEAANNSVKKVTKSLFTFSGIDYLKNFNFGNNIKQENSVNTLLERRAGLEKEVRLLQTGSASATAEGKAILSAKRLELIKSSVALNIYGTSLAGATAATYIFRTGALILISTLNILKTAFLGLLPVLAGAAVMQGIIGVWKAFTNSAHEAKQSLKQFKDEVQKVVNVDKNSLTFQLNVDYNKKKFIKEMNWIQKLVNINLAPETGGALVLGEIKAQQQLLKDMQYEANLPNIPQFIQSANAGANKSLEEVEARLSFLMSWNEQLKNSRPLTNEQQKANQRQIKDNETLISQLDLLKQAMNGTGISFTKIADTRKKAIDVAIKSENKALLSIEKQLLSTAITSEKADQLRKESTLKRVETELKAQLGAQKQLQEAIRQRLYMEEQLDYEEDLRNLEDAINRGDVKSIVSLTGDDALGTTLQAGIDASVKQLENVKTLVDNKINKIISSSEVRTVDIIGLRKAIEKEDFDAVLRISKDEEFTNQVKQAINDGKAQIDNAKQELLNLIPQMRTDSEKLLKAILEADVTQLQELGVDKKLVEDLKATQDKVYELEKDATIKRIELIETIRKAEEQRRQDAINYAEKERQLEIKRALKDKSITQKTSDELLKQSNQERIKEQLKLEEANYARLKNIIIDYSQTAQTVSAAIEGKQQQILASKNRRNELEIELIDSQIEAENQLKEAVTNSLKAQQDIIKEHNDFLTKQLDFAEQSINRAKELSQLRFDVSKTYSDANTSRRDIRIEQLERAKAILEQLRTDENLSLDERRTLLKELGTLGVSSKATELSLTQKINRIEEENRKAKLNALQAEFNFKQQVLDIERQTSELEAKKAVLSAQTALNELQQKRLDAVNAIAESETELNSAKQAYKEDPSEDNKKRLEVAQSQFDLSQESLNLLDQNIDLGNQQLDFANDYIIQLKEINRLKQEQLNIERGITLEQEKANQNKESNEGKLDEAKARQTTADSQRQKAIQDRDKAIKDAEKERDKTLENTKNIDERKQARDTYKDAVKTAEETYQESLRKINDSRQQESREQGQRKEINKTADTSAVPNLKPIQPPVQPFNTNTIYQQLGQPTVKPQIPVTITSNNDAIIAELKNVRTALETIQRPEINQTVEINSTASVDDKELIRKARNAAYDGVWSAINQIVV